MCVPALLSVPRPSPSLALPLLLRLSARPASYSRGPPRGRRHFSRWAEHRRTSSSFREFAGAEGALEGRLTQWQSGYPCDDDDDQRSALFEATPVRREASDAKGCLPRLFGIERPRSPLLLLFVFAPGTVIQRARVFGPPLSRRQGVAADDPMPPPAAASVGVRVPRGWVSRARCRAHSARARSCARL